MKKILSFFILTIFCFTNFSVLNVSANENNSAKMYKQLIITKSSLSKTRKGKKYIKSIDTFILKIKNNKKQLDKLSNKLSKLLDSNSIRNKNTLNIIKYLDAKINIALFKISLEEKKVIFTENISKSEKKKIEDRIIKLQLNTVDKTEKLIKILTDEFENLTNVEETGDFEIDYNMDYEQIGSFNGNLKVSDYTSSISGFDSQFKGKIEALFQAIPKGEDEIKLEINSMIDFISKDGNFYMLLKDFNIIDEKGVDNLEDFLSKTKEIAVKNKYIKYSDKQTQAGLNIIKSLNPKTIISDGRDKLSKPLITAYKKEGNKYFLKPTKYACDTAKELMNKFDPFSPNSCTDSQYKDLLKKINEAGKFYAEISGDKTIIGFELNPQMGVDKFNGYIIFTEKGITKVNAVVIDKAQGQVINLDYIKNEHLNLNIKDKSNYFNFKSDLTKDNKFKKIDLNLNVEEYLTKTKANLQLNNHKITGNFKVLEAYEFQETPDLYFQDIFTANIFGKTNSKDSLSELSIDYIGKELRTGDKILDGKFDYSNRKVSFENNIKFEGYKSNVLISADLDTNNMIDSGDIKILAYNYDKKIVDIDINIKNKNISGTTNIFYLGQKLLTITHTGNYGNKKIKLDNSFVISDDFIKFQFQGYSQDAQNSKVVSDLRDIVSSIEVGLTRGTFEISEIMLNNNKINFNILGVYGIYKDDYKHPDGSDYLIFIKENQYQIYGTTIDREGNIIAKIIGNYYKKDNSDSESLVVINGDIIKNNDIIGKAKVKKEEIKNVKGNVNIDIDTSDNKNDFIFFINTLFGDDEIFNLSIKNIGKRVYKKIDIKKPTNIIDYKEAFGIEEDNNYYNNSYYY